MIINKWDRRFLEAAKCISNWSPDPSSKIGAVAINDQNLPLAWGWNAFPRKMVSLTEAEVDKETKYKYVIHAEANTVYNCTRNNISLLNAKLYVYGIPPCIDCAKAIIQVGIKQVFSLVRRETSSKWMDSYQDSVKLFQEVGIESRITYE